MVKEHWKIYWNAQTAQTYLYGSEITMHAKDHVEFHNQLLPPGTVIKRWFSKVNYQAMRIEPTLPIIDGERKYALTLDLKEDNSDTQDGVIIRIVFYDRYDTEAGDLIMRRKSMQFQCPLKTYSYEIQLISAGTTGFHFHSMTIMELADEE